MEMELLRKGIIGCLKPFLKYGFLKGHFESASDFSIPLVQVRLSSNVDGLGGAIVRNSVQHWVH